MQEIVSSHERTYAMGRYIGKRILQSLLVILGVSILIFILSRVIPGDPGRLALGPRATQEAVDALNRELYVDRPLPVQYVYWLRDVFRGDLGTSIITRRSVSLDVKQFLPATIELMLFAGLFMTLGAIFLGKRAAKHRDGVIDGLVRFLSYAGIAMPAFVVSILLLLLFGHFWQVIPVLGRLSPGVAAPNRVTGLFFIDSLLAGRFATAWDAFLHILLPAFALSLGGMFQNARLMRNALVENSGKEYMTVSRSYGLPEKRLLNRYLMKPSSGSVITVMGLDLAAMLGNAFLVEKIFNWPGLSNYGVNSMLNKDLNAIVAVVIIIGIIYTIVNIIVDMIVAYLDPRIRQKRVA